MADLLLSPDEIPAWLRIHAAPTALARRENGESGGLLRMALTHGFSDWLRVGTAEPDWNEFTPRLTALGRGSHDLGFGISVMIQNLVTGLHLGLHASLPGARDVFERARRGESIVSFAASEPNVGAHPGKLSCRAERQGTAWIVNGLKTFSSNGFVADEIITIAVSGETSGRKRFVALVIPADSPGLTREEIKTPICPTVTHATIRFDNVRVDDSRRLGEEGEAFLKIVRPFRAYEDLAGAALFLGHLQGMEENATHFAAESRGRLRALLAGLEAGVAAASRELTAGRDSDSIRLALPYLLEPAAKLIAENPCPDPLWMACANDLAMITLGGNVRRKFYERLGTS